MAPKPKTTEFFVNQLINFWGTELYNYDKVIYISSNKKIIITCKKHGDFLQLAGNHLRGYGCAKCGDETKNKKIIENKSIAWNAKIIEVHKNNLLNFEKTKYEHSEKPVIVTCEKHGDFEILALNLVNGVGCRKCYLDKKLNDKKYFVNKSIEKHGDLYDYTKSEYTGTRNDLIIICNIHGEFLQNANNHMNQGKGCPKCAEKYKISETEVLTFIESLGITNIIINDRNILNGKELDIYLPDYNLAIEFNGLYWHSDIYKNDNYHLQKTENCLKKEITLIHIFEDEWVFKQDIVKSRLRNLLGKIENKIYGRNTIVKIIDSQTTRNFLNKHHIQGFVAGSIYLGLYYSFNKKEYLVSVMTFGSLRKSLGNTSREGSYELLRFCNAINHSIIGSASKLLKYFEKEYNPRFLLSYADRRWSNGSIYETLNFTLSHKSPPNYFYVNGLNREGRFNYRKDILISKYGCKPENTERNFMKNVLGYNRIYDSGALVYHKEY